MTDEKEDLNRNHIYPNTLAHMIYMEFRKTGLDHKASVIKVVDAISSLEMQGIDKNLQKIIKDAFFHVQGSVDGKDQ